MGNRKALMIMFTFVKENIKASLLYTVNTVVCYREKKLSDLEQSICYLCCCVVRTWQFKNPYC